MENKRSCRAKHTLGSLHLQKIILNLQKTYPCYVDTENGRVEIRH